MLKNLKIAVLAGALMAGTAATASADSRVRFNVSIGVPAPVYYPAPVVVYTPPEPVVYYYPPAAYYPPAVQVVYPGRSHWRHHHRHHPHRHWR